MSKLIRSVGVAATLSLLAVACGKNGENGGPSTAMPSGGNGSTGGSGGGGRPSTGNGDPGMPSVPGTPDTSVKTALPALPALANVTSKAVGDSVSLTVEPVAGAKDYRVYVLPKDEDISNEGGVVTVKNAIYRCSGNRQSVPIKTDVTKGDGGQAVFALVNGVDVNGYSRKEAEATLGYVYVTPGDGRVAVHAMGDPSDDADNSCFNQRWLSTRVKRYVASESEYKDLLSKRWRDDGIAFYIPADDAGSATIYTDGGEGGENPLFFTDGAEKSKRGGAKAVFKVMGEAPSEATADVVPLKRVFLRNDCGLDHDELVAGESRFERVRKQGDQLPLFDLHWSGITEETTLVVEALDQGCPYPGTLSPISVPGAEVDNITYEKFNTLAEMQAASPTGEVYINGQHDAKNVPKAIARSFVKIGPGPKPDLDWFLGFGADETVPDGSTYTAKCENPGNPNCLAEYRHVSDYGDISFTSATRDRWGMTNVLGELWVIYADVGADVGGKFRFTAPKRADVTADKYVHVTMEADAYTTTRRYPQIIVSDGALPVQWNLESSNTVIFQLFPDQGTANWPYVFQMQICDHRVWDVNNQCPGSDVFRLKAQGQYAPIPEASELTGVDRSTSFDVYLSTKRAYMFFDGHPYACLDLPAKGIPSGESTVSFGDVIYHSGVDEVQAFHEEHQKFIAKRHLDNLGFKSGVEGPAWDEQVLPCFPADSISN